MTFVRAIGQQFDLPTIIVLWIPSIPIVLYAAVCLLFFHALKRRLTKLLATRSRDSSDVH
jgi:hypothetical protein